MRPTAFISMVFLVASTLCGCASSQEDRNEAYRRGDLSSADKRQLDEQSREKMWADQERSMQQLNQEPRSNPRYEKVVNDQPIEDPQHTGRPLDETN